MFSPESFKKYQESAPKLRTKEELGKALEEGLTGTSPEQKNQYDIVKTIIVTNHDVALFKELIGHSDYESTHSARWLAINVWNANQ